MEIDDVLARLSAGLDRDEQLARAATELPRPITKYPEKRPPWAPERWVVDRGDLRSMNGVADPIHDLEGGTRSEAVADHMARQDPARTLRQVDAIRNPLEVYRSKAADLETAISDGDQTYAAYSEGYRDACLMFVRALASIYADPAETGGEP